MAPNELNVIALISGGKDSLYTILHCIKHGHKVVALANLHPPSTPLWGEEGESGEQLEDMDSFMYQTIGHAVIPLYEEALGIRLYRAPITGEARDTSRVYRYDAEDQMADSEQIEDDETESLMPLLRRIKKENPTANAVSAGAILSTYQRTRIENVASRLGLIPLAWLWMYPMLPPPAERKELNAVSSIISDVGLLEDMASCGCESRIVKVASGGLHSDFLWGDVTSLDGTLRRSILKAIGIYASSDLRGAALGEGGEYETLALNGPGFLWKKRIIIDEDEREVKIAGGGVSYLTIKGARCISKPATEDRFEPQSVRRPVILEETFVMARDSVQSIDYKELTAEWVSAAMSQQSQLQIETAQSICEPFWTIANVSAPEAGWGASEQMKLIAKKIEDILQSSEAHTRTVDDIVFVSLLLREMNDFTAVNRVYATLFKKPNPPARVTVACGDSLPRGIQIMASFVVDLGHRTMRDGLHVQSRSYWAPSNIGPYSQSIAIPWSEISGSGTGTGLVYIAGQIPLDPASMEIAEELMPEENMWFTNYTLHAALSLQHLWRIGKAMQVDWWLGAVAFLAGEEQIHVKARAAWDLWEIMNRQRTSEDGEEEETPDLWDFRYGRQVPLNARYREPTFPNFAVVNGEPEVPPFFAVQVDELPRNSDIEWQGLGLRCESLVTTHESPGDHIKIQSSIISHSVMFSSIEISVERFDHSFEPCVQQALNFCGQKGAVSNALIYTPHPLSTESWKGQIIPCKSIWGTQGRRLGAGITLQIRCQ
ncbi:hypothetical protein Egran_06400 [Elaphomyces granulatus]|uniref:Diphthine--ammonia ligase n=1 Tax=Elaphomyces granulatus TaxID=519963 RepID=A0A232LNY3_9EURO|nr:hypothetical protein Egran_06400 [Elaphomyces granulatus]